MGKDGKRWETARPKVSLSGRKEKKRSLKGSLVKTMLLGQYESKVDDKGRISFPVRFREVLGDKIIVTQGYENSLIIVSEQEWDSLLEGTRGRPFIEYETRETQRFLLGGASLASLDSKGRFVLPGYLRTFAGIEDNAVFLGLSRYVELWDKNKWTAYRVGLEKNIDGISKRLVEKKKEGESE